MISLVYCLNGNISSVNTLNVRPQSLQRNRRIVSQRTAPLESLRIRELVDQRYEEAVKLGSKYLFNHTQSKDGRKLSHTRLTYERYKDLYESIVKELGLSPEHKAHDGRAHFATMAKKYNMDEYAIKRIMGHSIKDLTERVYTTRDIEWLREEMEKIKG